MNRVLLFSFVIITVINISSANTIKCSANETYSTCYNDCHHLCHDYYKTRENCPANCKIGCACSEGFVRENGKCLKPGDCVEKPKCDVNEEFYPFGSCIGTCEKPDAHCIELVRQPRCDCKSGFVRNHLGKCIKKDDC